MLSRIEYERAVKCFLVELNHLCKNATESELRSLPGFGRPFAEVIDEYLRDMLDPENEGHQMLYLAYSFLDEYCYADREKVMGAAYEAYTFDQSRPPRDEIS